MEEVVKYFCRQADYHYGAYTGFPPVLPCIVKEGGNCVGISGHVLNSKASAFLSYRRPRKPEPRYEIQWIYDEGVLYPQVIVIGQGPYIGVRASEPGVLTPQVLGRQCCADREETRLKLQKCERADAQKLMNQAALWQDQFPLLKGERNAMRSFVLMAIVEEIQSEASVEVLSSAENSLLLFFAPDTIFSLEEYICRETSVNGRWAALSFLSTYCKFLMDLLPKCLPDGLNAVLFSRCFETYWGINLIDIFRDLIDKPDNIHRQLGEIPDNDKTFPKMLQETLSECVNAVVYENRFRAARRIYQKLEEFLDKNDSAVRSQLEVIRCYLDTVVLYRHSSRAG